MSSFWVRKLCMNQHFTFGWKGLDKKKKMNMKDELAFKTKRGIY